MYILYTYLMEKPLTIPQIRLGLFDRIICKFAPSWGLKRIRSKAAIGYLGDNGYIAPGSSRRSMRGWNPGAYSADTDIIPKLNGMRAGSRDMFMNTPIARGAIKRTQINAVGSGLFLQSRVDRKFLGLSDDVADAWELNTEREFHSWASSPECDAARTQNFYDLTSLAFASVLLSGDVFAAFPFIPRPGQNYDLRIKLVESDYVSNPNMVMDTPALAGGIEVDDHGAPIKYYFRKPSSMYAVDLGPQANDLWEPVNAYNSSGMRQVLHLFEKERPGQRRGVPFLTPVTEILKQISRYSKAEIDAAIINSFFTVFVKHLSSEGKLESGYIPPTQGVVPGGPNTKVVSESDPADDVLYEIGSGNVVDMMKDEEIQIADPKHPKGNFDKFFLAVIKQIGCGLNIPFEVLILHFSSSYSAARASLNEAWKFFLTKRIFMSRYFCQPTYEWFMTEAILKGRISAPGFFSDPAIKAAWLNSAWVGPGRGMIEPKREIEASEMAIKARLSTYEDEYIKLNGGNWSGAMDRLSREKKYLSDKDLNSEALETPDEGEGANADTANKENTNEGDGEE